MKVSRLGALPAEFEYQRQYPSRMDASAPERSMTGERSVVRPPSTSKEFWSAPASRPVTQQFWPGGSVWSAPGCATVACGMPRSH